MARAARDRSGGFGAGRLRRLEYLVVVSLVLFMAAMAVAAFYAGFGEIVARLSRLSAGLVAALLALSLANYALRALRWHLYSRHLGLRIPPGLNLLHFIAGFSLTTTPGKVGEALRLWLIERCHGHRYERIVPLFLGDRLADMNAVMLLCLVGIAGFPDQLWIAALAGLGLLFLSLSLAFPRPLIAALAGAYAAGGRRGPRLFARARAALRQTARLFAPRLLLVALALSLAGWLAEAYAFHWLLAALGAGLSLLQATFVFTFAIVVGAVSMLPGGLGSAEATMVALLVALGVDLETALAATAVIRATTLWFGVALGFVALPVALKLARSRRAPGAVALP
jgi:uncharacterized membrane protein YbhN (UPF0104 family)